MVFVVSKVFLMFLSFFPCFSRHLYVFFVILFLSFCPCVLLSKKYVLMSNNLSLCLKNCILVYLCLEIMFFCRRKCLAVPFFLNTFATY